MKKLFTFFAAMLVALAVNATKVNITPTSPYESDAVRLALYYSAEGDTIVLAAGTYEESNSDYIAFRRHNVVMAAEGANVIIKPHVSFRVRGGARAELNGVKIDASELNTLSTSYENIFEVHDATAGNCWVLKNCEVYGNSAKTLLRHASGKTLDSVIIDGCYIHNNPQAILRLQDASLKGVIIKNSTFAEIANGGSFWCAPMDISTTAEDAKVVVDHCTFYHVTSISSSYADVTVGYDGSATSDVTVSNCIIAQPEAYEGSRAINFTNGGVVENCLVFNYTKSTNGIQGASSVNNCIYVDPLFVNAAEANYTLGEGSPALTMNNGEPIGDPRWVAEDEPATANDWCEIPMWHFYGVNPTADPNSYIIFSIIDNEDGTITFKITNDPGNNTQTFDYLQINPLGIMVGADAEEGTSSISATYTIPDATTKLENLEILWSNPNWTGRWMVQNVTIDLANDEFCEKIVEPVAFYSDFEIDLRQGQLGTDENNPNNKYLAIDGEDYIYTDDAPAMYNAYLTSAKYNGNQHGYVDFVATIPVEAGNYKITVGNCTHNNKNGAVKNADGTETLELIDKNGQTITAIETPNNCYHQNTAENITSVWFVAEAEQTIQIVCPQYTPYIKVEKVAEVPAAVTVYTVTYMNAEGATGVVPAALSDVEPNTKITLPKNFSMYKEGYTFAAWYDGDDVYDPGSEYEVTDDVILMAMYEENNVSLANRTEAVTIKWEFSQQKGVAPINVSGAETFVVAQATIGGEVIDVQLPIDATLGKFVNSSNSWTQINPGVIFYIPSAKGAVITYKQYNAGETSTPEINVEDDDDTYTLVAEGTSGQLYYEYIQVVLPTPEATAIDNTDVSEKSVKFIENGQLYILKNGAKYNAQGAVVK